MGNYQGIIGRVVNASTPERLCSALNWSKLLLKAGIVNETAFAEELQAVLKEKANSLYKSVPKTPAACLSLTNISIYNDSTAMLMFLSFITNAAAGEKLLNQIDYILGLFQSCTSKPTGGIISKREVLELLELVQRKYGMVSAVTYHRELEVYIINRSHICYDSFLLTFKHTATGQWLNKWLLFCLSPKAQLMECNKYYVFIHEIGHVLYNAIVESTQCTPDMLDEIALVMGMQDIARKKPDEFFSDIFSAAALHDSDYTQYNPFKSVIPEKLYVLLDLYFKSLIYRLEEANKEVTRFGRVLH